MRFEAGDFPRLDALHPGDDRGPGEKPTGHNPFDVTKVWPKAEYPLIEVGVMELNRYPDNFSLRGAGRVLAGQHRARHQFFARQDAAGAAVSPMATRNAYRLGVNFNHIPVKRPKVPVPKLPSRRQDADRRQSGRNAHLQSQHARGSGTTSRILPSRRSRSKGDAAQLGPPRRRRSLGTAGKPFPEDDSRRSQQLLFENTARAMGDAKLHIKERYVRQLHAC